MEEEDITFEEQLHLEEAEKKRKEDIAAGRIKKDDDGTVYDWNEEKKAWFPRVDEDFLARYQMSYGTDSNIPVPPAVDDPAYAQWYYTYMMDTNSDEYKKWYEYYYGKSQQATSDRKDDPDKALEDAEAGVVKGDHGMAKAEEPSSSETPEDKAKKRKKEEPTWFEATEETHCNVYVQGLPDEITDEQFVELMQKCGLIMYDPLTKKPKAKLYKDAEGNNKGDGRCCYIRKESVDLALKILDGYNYNGSTLSVEKAHFELKGNFDPTKKKRKLTNKEKKKMKEKQEKLFDWRPDLPRGIRLKWESTIIIKNLFTLEALDADPLFLSQIQEDLRSEGEKFGEIKKLIIYDNNPDGVASITYKEPEEADVCKESIHGRFFAGRQITAETWDGRTKYKVEESEEQQKERLARYEKFLESEDEKTAAAAETIRVTKEEEEKMMTTQAMADRQKEEEKTTKDAQINIEKEEEDIGQGDEQIVDEHHSDKQMEAEQETDDELEEEDEENS